MKHPGRKARYPLRTGRRPAATSGPGYSSTAHGGSAAADGLSLPGHWCCGSKRSLGAQNPEGGDRFYPFSISNEKGVDLSVSPDDFLCFKHIQLQVIFCTTAGQLLYLSPACCLISISDEPNQLGVIGIQYLTMTLVGWVGFSHSCTGCRWLRDRPAGIQ